MPNRTHYGLLIGNLYKRIKLRSRVGLCIGLLTVFQVGLIGRDQSSYLVSRKPYAYCCLIAFESVNDDV